MKNRGGIKNRVGVCAGELKNLVTGFSFVSAHTDNQIRALGELHQIEI